MKSIPANTREQARECRLQAAYSRSQLDQSRSSVASTWELLAETQQRHGFDEPPDTSPSSAVAILEERRREEIAARRLLEWEAEDLAEVAPGEMGTPRRRFAAALYEMIALSRSLGMSEERFLYHLRYALDRYAQEE